MKYVFQYPTSSTQKIISIQGHLTEINGLTIKNYICILYYNENVEE